MLSYLDIDVKSSIIGWLNRFFFSSHQVCIKLILIIQIYKAYLKFCSLFKQFRKKKWEAEVFDRSFTAIENNSSCTTGI